MKRLSVLAWSSTVAVIAACADPAEAPLEPSVNLLAGEQGAVHVTTDADAGPGSFRQAVLDANSHPEIGVIHFHPGLGTIVVQEPVVYTGAQALVVDGAGAEMDGSALGAEEAVLVASGGGDLSFRRLTVRNAPGNGITVAVPGAATGVFTVALDEVTIQDNAEHGVLINDQAEYFTDPNSTSPAGSDASVVVHVSRSHFEGNGSGALDRDGLRINEGGLGTLEAVIRGTGFVGNGADGLELDERGTGDAVFAVEHTDFTANGFFSAGDFDDGIDVDEAGDGHVIGRFVHATANDNAEQGIDLNENDAGDLRVTMRQVEGSRNAEEGIEFEEDDDFAGGGDIVAELYHVTTLANGAADGDAGLKLREKGVGSVVAHLVAPVSSENAIGGILVREDAAGDLNAEFVNTVALHNGDDGIKLDENGDGALDGELIQATSSDNDGAGVALEQAPGGTGEARIQALTTTGNAEGAIQISGDVTVVQTP